MSYSVMINKGLSTKFYVIRNNVEGFLQNRFPVIKFGTGDGAKVMDSEEDVFQTLERFSFNTANDGKLKDCVICCFTLSQGLCGGENLYRGLLLRSHSLFPKLWK